MSLFQFVSIKIEYSLQVFYILHSNLKTEFLVVRLPEIYFSVLIFEHYYLGSVIVTT
jgi:hypothetical protein